MQLYKFNFRDSILPSYEYIKEYKIVSKIGHFEDILIDDVVYELFYGYCHNISLNFCIIDIDNIDNIAYTFEMRNYLKQHSRNNKINELL